VVYVINNKKIHAETHKEAAIKYLDSCADGVELGSVFRVQELNKKNSSRWFNTITLLKEAGLAVIERP